MAMTVDRGLEQRQTAIKNATAIRVANAQVKRDLKAGQLSLADALRVETVGSARLWDVLMAVPGWGRAKTARLLAAQQISPAKRVEGLSGRQRAALVDEVEGWQR